MLRIGMRSFLQNIDHQNKLFGYSQPDDCHKDNAPLFFPYF
ncbi:MAG: hypothetical protein ETSY2_06835 [Candidatus Entotheonella gemina]|uniref:Uncharacterized protein n=1 Tax=Candidatus Entotheonella gemina TaxID=1429439 RepID=W4MCX3_9BACT|nr:MAG: hypothetical protein ETSY2_06835 [Candidatus Entotheonella gemina]